MGIIAGDRRLTWEQRFWRHIDKTEGCWHWNGGTGGKGSTRYGVWNSPSGRTSAHRVAYVLLIGHLADDDVLDHLCGNTLCVNPAHLEPVTATENRRRQRERKTHCKRGHELAGSNLYVDARGHRGCKTCRRMTSTASQRRRRALRRN